MGIAQNKNAAMADGESKTKQKEQTPFFKPMAPQPGDKVLWIRLSAFGDVLQAGASAQRFKMKYPDVRVTFLTKPVFADLIRNQPYIDEVIAWDVKKKPLDFFKVVRTVRASNFKWLFSMHRVLSVAAVALFSRIRQRFGYNRTIQFCYRQTHWESLDYLGVDFMRRDSVAIFTTEEDRNRANQMLSGLPEKKIFAIIGASKEKKLWPTEHWITFLSRLAEQGWGIILNGNGASEEGMALEIENAISKPCVLNLVGHTTFPLLAAVARASTVAIGNDTGPLHLAALVGTPTMGFFGVTDAYVMDLRMPWFRDIRVSCPKAGCWNYVCPLDCLSGISPKRALSEFHDFAARIRRPEEASAGSITHGL
ncbi:MAG: glycosyltransferase family 9 protein [Synergistaceae bacterium]|nr:glycosyltransferase family 9 protein [Synergistaceae bacterium]